MNKPSNNWITLVTRNLPFTTSYTSACAFPNMLTTEQLYFPASFPATFFNSSFPPDTVQGLNCDWLFILLHFITGLGLPFTEHLNEADPPSLTVSILGDTATTGAEIDSPGSPLAPGMPAGPMSPFRPLSSTSPFGPAGPRWPLFPGNLRNPFSPLGPGGPRGPGIHIPRCGCETCCFNLAKVCLFSELYRPCFDIPFCLRCYQGCACFDGGQWTEGLQKLNLFIKYQYLTV